MSKTQDRINAMDVPDRLKTALSKAIEKTKATVEEAILSSFEKELARKDKP